MIGRGRKFLHHVDTGDNGIIGWLASEMASWPWWKDGGTRSVDLLPPPKV